MKLKRKSDQHIKTTEPDGRVPVVEPLRESGNIYLLIRSKLCGCSGNFSPFSNRHLVRPNLVQIYFVCVCGRILGDVRHSIDQIGNIGRIRCSAFGEASHARNGRVENIESIAHTGRSEGRFKS